MLLGEAVERELAVGTVGQFWKATGGTVKIADAAAFVAFDRRGYAKAALNFRVEPGPGSLVTLSTETRIVVPDIRARRKFAMYWRLIYPGSALIRRMWLGAIKRRAEG